MNKETMLLNAAKAMGFEVILNHETKVAHYHSKYGLFIKMRDGCWWNPLESSADCAEMEDALCINVSWIDVFVSCDIMDNGLMIAEFNAEYKDHPNKGAARRYASTMVAALIGEKL